MTRSRSIRLSRTVALAALAMACNSRAPDADVPPEPARDGAYLAASAGDRIAVAEVEGVTIYGDCVATQSRALGLTREQALDQCVAFELLAQAAQKRGKDRDPDVLWTARTEAARRLLDVEVTAAVPDPDTVGEKARAVFDDAYQRYRKRIYRPEIRHVAHVLAQTDKDTAEGSPEDRAARALAADIHAAVAGRRDLDADEFFALAKDVAGDRPLGPADRKTGEFRPERFKIYPGYPNIHPVFTDAVFAVPEAGAVSPPVRTHVGWHVILVTEIEPARNTTADQAADTLVELLRRERYLALVSGLQKNTRVEVNEQALSALQAAEDALRFAPSESP